MKAITIEMTGTHTITVKGKTTYPNQTKLPNGVESTQYTGIDIMTADRMYQLLKDTKVKRMEFKSLNYVVHVRRYTDSHWYVNVWRDLSDFGGDTGFAYNKFKRMRKSEVIDMLKIFDVFDDTVRI